MESNNNQDGTTKIESHIKTNQQNKNNKSDDLEMQKQSQYSIDKKSQLSSSEEFDQSNNDEENIKIKNKLEQKQIKYTPIKKYLEYMSYLFKDETQTLRQNIQHSSTSKSQKITQFYEFKNQINEIQKKILSNHVFQRSQFYTDRIIIHQIQTIKNFEIVFLTIQYGWYFTKIKIFNYLSQTQNNQSPVHKLCCVYDCGSFGTIYLTDFQKNNYSIKCINIAVDKNIFKTQENQTQIKSKLLLEALKQYFFVLLFSQLQIGPKIKKIFEFDLFITSNCVQFSMEICKPMKEEPKDKQIIKQSLKMLHLLKIVHRDIKIQNIMYSQTFQKNVFIDFGSASFLNESMGQKSFTYFVGTTGYCSDQMFKLVNNKKGYVDLYYNDIFGLKKVLSRLQFGNKFAKLEYKNLLLPPLSENNQQNKNDFFFENRNTFFYLIRLKYYLICQNYQQFYCNWRNMKNQQQKEEFQYIQSQLLKFIPNLSPQNSLPLIFFFQKQIIYEIAHMKQFLHSKQFIYILKTKYNFNVPFVQPLVKDYIDYSEKSQMILNKDDSMRLQDSIKNTLYYRLFYNLWKSKDNTIMSCSQMYLSQLLNNNLLSFDQNHQQYKNQFQNQVQLITGSKQTKNKTHKNSKQDEKKSHYENLKIKESKHYQLNHNLFSNHQKSNKSNDLESSRSSKRQEKNNIFQNDSYLIGEALMVVYYCNLVSQKRNLVYINKQKSKINLIDQEQKKVFDSKQFTELQEQKVNICSLFIEKVKSTFRNSQKSKQLPCIEIIFELTFICHIQFFKPIAKLFQFFLFFVWPYIPPLFKEESLQICLTNLYFLGFPFQLQWARDFLFYRLSKMVQQIDQKIRTLWYITLFTRLSEEVFYNYSSNNFKVYIDLELKNSINKQKFIVIEKMKMDYAYYFNQFSNHDKNITIPNPSYSPKQQFKNNKTFEQSNVYFFKNLIFNFADEDQKFSNPSKAKNYVKNQSKLQQMVKIFEGIDFSNLQKGKNYLSEQNSNKLTKQNQQKSNSSKLMQNQFILKQKLRSWKKIVQFLINNQALISQLNNQNINQQNKFFFEKKQKEIGIVNNKINKVAKSTQMKNPYFSKFSQHFSSILNISILIKFSRNAGNYSQIKQFFKQFKWLVNCDSFYKRMFLGSKLTIAFHESKLSQIKQVVSLIIEQANQQQSQLGNLRILSDLVSVIYQVFISYKFQNQSINLQAKKNAFLKNNLNKQSNQSDMINKIQFQIGSRKLIQKLIKKILKIITFYCLIQNFRKISFTNSNYATFLSYILRIIKGFSLLWRLSILYRKQNLQFLQYNQIDLEAFSLYFINTDQPEITQYEFLTRQQEQQLAATLSNCLQNIEANNSLKLCIKQNIFLFYQKINTQLSLIELKFKTMDTNNPSKQYEFMQKAVFNQQYKRLQNQETVKTIQPILIHLNQEALKMKRLESNNKNRSSHTNSKHRISKLLQQQCLPLQTQAERRRITNYQPDGSVIIDPKLLFAYLNAKEKNLIATISRILAVYYMSKIYVTQYSNQSYQQFLNFYHEFKTDQFFYHLLFGNFTLRVLFQAHAYTNKSYQQLEMFILDIVKIMQRIPYAHFLSSFCANFNHAFLESHIGYFQKSTNSWKPKKFIQYLASNLHRRKFNTESYISLFYYYCLQSNQISTDCKRRFLLFIHKSMNFIDSNAKILILKRLYWYSYQISLKIKSEQALIQNQISNHIQNQQKYEQSFYEKFSRAQNSNNTNYTNHTNNTKCPKHANRAGNKQNKLKQTKRPREQYHREEIYLKRHLRHQNDYGRAEDILKILIEFKKKMHKWSFPVLHQKLFTRKLTKFYKNLKE